VRVPFYALDARKADDSPLGYGRVPTHSTSPHPHPHPHTGHIYRCENTLPSCVETSPVSLK
jgi:hypothetical protein